MDIDIIRPFLKYMYEKNNAVWAGQLSYDEFTKRATKDDYELMELEISETLICLLYNKKTHKLYTRGKASTDEMIRVIRSRINDLLFRKIDYVCVKEGGNNHGN